MFCPNCGKQVKDFDNFCRYCGADLKNDQSVEKTKAADEEYIVHHYNEPETQKYEFPPDNGEELVLYDVKKHWMALFWPVFLTPVFFIYFWVIFLNTHSIFSWIIVLLILIPIIYPILRFNSDKIIITTKFAHIKIGVINPVEIDIPLSKIEMLDISQTTMGRILDYGTVSFNHNAERYDYGYIKNPGDLEYIIENPARFVNESLEEDND